MNETAVTIILLAIGAGAIWLGYWVVTHRGGNARAANAGGDPNSLSADSAEVITARTK
jgi:threonine/homoserine efflux transporter RhtA